MRLPDVVAITDRGLPDDDLVDRAERMLKAAPVGAVGVQLRDNDRPSLALFRLAQRLRAICAGRGAPFYVNDRVDVAIAVGADGVHLGGRSIEVKDARELLGQRAFVSVAAHRAGDVQAGETSGATAALVSPIFATPGKGSPAGLGLLAQARTAAPTLRVYALGGVDAGNAGACVKAGAHGVAVVRALWRAPQVETAVLALVHAVRDAGA
jgi:thiamine-phosphate pyrophosphorylase